MKRILTLVFVLVLQNNLKAQVTYHFPHYNAVWGQFTGVCCFPGLTGSTYFLAANGDTVVNGNSYIKLYQSDSTGSVLNLVNEFIREDSFGRIFYYNHWANQDTLLYDFNLQIGDTAKVYTSATNIFPLIVDSISNIQIGSQIRKHIHFDQGNSWIEGIGSSDGLLYPYGGQYIIDGVAWLTCFKENDTLKYGDVCNQVFVGIDNILSENEIEISPNPSNGIIEIDLDKNRGGELMIYNSVGQLIQKDIISNSSNKISINLSNQPDGIYFVRIIKENKILSAKLVVEKGR